VKGLPGKVAVVTGAGTGLGRAVSLYYAHEGARVVALSLHRHELDEVRSAAADAGADIKTIAADIGDPAQATEVIDDVLGRHGHVDVLVNNAGIIYVKAIEETTPEEWDRVINTNLRGPFLYARALAPSMKSQRDGMIINVSSMSGVQGFVGESAYCPSKFGLEGLTATLSLEFAPWNIRVVSVHPGVGIRTPMSMSIYDEESRKTWLDPMDLAPAFLHLATNTDPSLSGGRFNLWEIVQRGAVEPELAHALTPPDQQSMNRM